MDHTLTIARLLSRQDAVGTTRLETDKLDPATLREGEILLRVDRFALTTNNITYAAYGDYMQYWAFFPSYERGWGHMPVWGFAEVAYSTVTGIDVGERFYGYFPMASHVIMCPERITDRGFYDGAPHRRKLTSAYNQYTRCSWDAYYNPHTEDLQMLLRPLFITSYMLADFIQDNACFGARRLVISSASSKTAYGVAFCLRDHDGVEIAALTSDRNRAFVENLGCYDVTLSYEELAELSTDQPTLYVDFSGNVALRDAVHAHFGDRLVYSCFAGSAQNTEAPELETSEGPKPEFFFAPVQIKKRNADWGPKEFNARFGEATRAFFARVADIESPWMRVVTHSGLAAAQDVVSALHAGHAKPYEGHVVRL